MAGFKTHIGVSGVLGVAYGGAGFAMYDVPLSTSLPTCVLAGGLCGVSGMLPDLDSGSGVPLRESVAFAAAVVPMLLLDRFHLFGMSNESIVLAGALVYLTIRFVMGPMLAKYTVHRGMFHSLPAAIIFAEAAFLICECDNLSLRYYKAGAVLLGFMSHLLLDELYSIEWASGRWRFKKSFGTAFKLWGDSMWGNLSTYGKLAALSFLVAKDPSWMEQMRPHTQEIPQIAERVMERLTR